MVSETVLAAGDILAAEIDLVVELVQTAENVRGVEAVLAADTVDLGMCHNAVVSGHCAAVVGAECQNAHSIAGLDHRDRPT